MAKCSIKSHESQWRIKQKIGNKKIIICIACEWEWESKSPKYDQLPRLTQEEIEKHLIGKYN